MDDPEPLPAIPYLLDNASLEAERRFDGLAGLFNPSTFRHIERLGIRTGWRCVVVGCRNEGAQDANGSAASGSMS